MGSERPELTALEALNQPRLSMEGLVLQQTKIGS